MIKLNLTTSNKSQEQIKEYLKANASEVLADKINNGVRIVKDNKTLLNKKDLNGFWKYATDEARKICEKGVNGGYVDNETVYGWAIHYFEEDSIEGTLYNEDGTEFKKEILKTTTPKVETKPQPKKPENKQATLFDLFSNWTQEETKENIEENEEEIEQEDDEEFTEEEQQEALEQLHKEQEQQLPEPQIEIIEKDNERVTVDTNTGEVLSKEQIEKSFGKETMYKLYSLLDGKLELR